MPDELGASEILQKREELKRLAERPKSPHSQTRLKAH